MDEVRLCLCVRVWASVCVCCWDTITVNAGLDSVLSCRVTLFTDSYPLFKGLNCSFCTSNGNRGQESRRTIIACEMHFFFLPELCCQCDCVSTRGLEAGVEENTLTSSHTPMATMLASQTEVMNVMWGNCLVRELVLFSSLFQ